VVLHEDAVLEHGDLRAAVALAHDHRPLHRLAAREELGLRDDLAATAGVAALTAALTLRLEARRALEGRDLVAVAGAGHGRLGALRAGAAPTPATPTARGGLATLLVVALLVGTVVRALGPVSVLVRPLGDGRALVVGALVVGVLLVSAVLGAAPAPAAAAAPATTAARTDLVLLA